MSSPPSTESSRDWRNLSLPQGGRSLIEASAGTGKTWTISVLYLRLLLEQELSPRRIVVTTFTNAAAEELRERLRARLLWAEMRANTGLCAAAADDATDEAWLGERWQDDAQCQSRDLQRLRVALAELDMAPITTLHGLCQRILSDHPFASGSLFKGGDLVSGDTLANDLAKDLQRLLNQGDESTEPLILLQRKAGVSAGHENLTKQLKLLLMPGSEVRCLSEEEIDRLLPKDWSDKLRELCAFFRADAVLSRSWRQLADFVENPRSGLQDAKDLEKRLLLAHELKSVLKAHKDDLRLQAAVEFSEQCVANGVLRQNEQQFWAEVANWARLQAKSRLSSLNQRTFDELLSAVRSALEGTAGRELADALFNAWPVALVDEFQDTDGVQYGILDRIYRDAEGSKRGRLVMIGDPKQAIYRFRGGDVEAYLRAASEVDPDGGITLDTNHRSSRSYVKAINEFYAVAGTGLCAEGGGRIQFEPVNDCGRRDDVPYGKEGQVCERPLIIHCNQDCPESADERRDAALMVCANQIHDMLTSGLHFIGSKPVQPSDIAVLLPTHIHVNSLRDRLRERGVPCVTTTQSSVFATETARELQIILYAVAHCSEPGPARSAVATRLWGVDYAGLRNLSDDPVAWQLIVGKLHAWRQAWQQGGVLAVIDALIDQVAADQLKATIGERVLTNLRHLGELLQTQSDEAGGIEELLAWFSDQRDSESDDSEDSSESRQLRIESDAKRVCLMTLHASKGLEFPIVFLPLMWAHGERSGIGLYQADSPDGGLRKIDVSDAAEKAEKIELQDERFRVLYVALTRAIHACHVFALPADRPLQKGSNGPAVGTARSALDVMLSRLQLPMDEEAQKKTAHICWVDGWHPAQKSQGQIAGEEVITVRQARDRPELPKGPLPAKHSFTTLTKRFQAIEPSNEDEGEEPAPSVPTLDDQQMSTRAEQETALVSTPHLDLIELGQVKGKDFGNAVHAIFENRQPNVPFAKQSELINRHLTEFNVRCRDGKDQDWLVAALARRLQVVLDTPLGADQGVGPRLADLGAADMRAEMEFYFALDGASMAALRAACGAHGEPDLVPAQSRSLAGLMNGKIDLVFQHDGRFHVLDYKGNNLGDSLEHYGGDALTARMDASDYRFQALLYTVAIDRYLDQRLKGYQRSKHLGDCYYIFIRAVGLGDGAGIWRHRFGDSLLDAVQAVLATTRSVEVAA